MIVSLPTHLVPSQVVTLCQMLDQNGSLVTRVFVGRNKSSMPYIVVEAIVVEMDKMLDFIRCASSEATIPLSFCNHKCVCLIDSKISVSSDNISCAQLTFGVKKKLSKPYLQDILTQLRVLRKLFDTTKSSVSAPQVSQKDIAEAMKESDAFFV